MPAGFKRLSSKNRDKVINCSVGYIRDTRELSKEAGKTVEAYLHTLGLIKRK